MIVLYHRGGPNPCGKPALGVRLSLSTYEIAAENVVKFDGTQPQRGDPIICGSCGMIIKEVAHLTKDPA